MAGGVDQAYLARGRCQGRILGTPGRCSRFIETSSQSDKVMAVGLHLDVDNGIGKMAVDLAEIFFLPASEIGLMAAGGKSKQQRKVNYGTHTDAGSGNPGKCWLAGEPEN